MQLVCQECYGKCHLCEEPATRNARGAPTKYCADCRPKTKFADMPPRENCGRCGKPRDGGHKYYCLECERERNRQRRQENHEHHALKDRKRTLRRFYGMTLEDYDDMLAAQGGGCAGCGASRSTLKLPKGQSDRGARGRLHIDHCHATGIVRGILCNGCNAALGQVKDNPATLRVLADYLERNL